MLEKIGFYTLSDARAEKASGKSPLWRCELILTGRCNFRCPYCRSVGGRDMSIRRAKATVAAWTAQGLKNIRFSGGEPTLYLGLPELVSQARSEGVERIAISTNGSASLALYKDLISRGVNDFSISLDACCSEDGDKMAGGRDGAFVLIENTIKELSKLVYTTVGIVLTSDNQKKAEGIIEYAAGLGVHDIRVIPAAQHGAKLPALNVEPDLIEKYSILKYRISKLKGGDQVRGLLGKAPHKCRIVLDDMAVMGDRHYPCIIYLREGGAAIGKMGPDMRDSRARWSENHNCSKDPICSKNCLDVCREYNETWEVLNAANQDA